MDDDIEYDDAGQYFAKGRMRKVTTTKKARQAHNVRQARLPALGAKRPKPAPSLPNVSAGSVTLEPIVMAPAAQAGRSADGDGDADGAADGAAPAGPATFPIVEPPPESAEAMPGPYNYAREEPAYGTFDEDYNDFEVRTGKKRGPVRNQVQLQRQTSHRLS